MLKLAVFNSIKYSFNKKTWVSNRARLQKGPNDKVNLKIYQNENQQKQNRPGQNRPDATRGGLRTFFVDVIKESPRIENR